MIASKVVAVTDDDTAATAHATDITGIGFTTVDVLLLPQLLV